MTEHDLVDRSLGFAVSDAAVERDRAIAWLLAHPDDVRPELIGRIERGEVVSPELYLRLLAAIGGEGAVAAATAALERAHRGEAFWAARALADLGPEGHAVLRDHVDDPAAEIREAVRSAEVRRDLPPGEEPATEVDQAAGGETLAPEA